MVATKRPESDKYLDSISEMVTSFPEILVDSSNWPESRVELAVRRTILTVAGGGHWLGGGLHDIESSAGGGRHAV